MRVTESLILPLEIINEVRRREQRDATRSGGVHVSDLVYCLRKAWLRGQPNYTEPEQSPSTTLLFATGKAIQAWLTGRLSDEPELHWDGITGTPDYRMDGVLTEFKATYASAAREVRTTQNYLDQLACYMVMDGTMRGYLVVYYINGYYNWMRKKKVGGDNERGVLKAFIVEFASEAERDAWAMEMRRRRALIQQATTLEDIPLTEHFTWECEYCPFFGTDCPGGPGRTE